MYDNVDEFLWDMMCYQLIIDNTISTQSKTLARHGYYRVITTSLFADLLCKSSYISISLSFSLFIFEKESGRWVPPVVWICSKSLSTREFFWPPSPPAALEGSVYFLLIVQ